MLKEGKISYICHVKPKSLMKHIFTTVQQALAARILEHNHFSPLSDLYSSEIQDLAVIWSFYSGKIEGNTYTFVETETLLKDGITSPRRYEEAKMLKNLYNTFISEVEYIKKGNTEEINKRLLFELHSRLIADLIDNRERGIIRKRAVRITGTDYTPPAGEHLIEKALDQIMEEQAEIENPLEKAVFLHCNIKRTSRLVESIVLMNDNIVPIHTTRLEDINTYRKALLSFYETSDYSEYADYFLQKKWEYLQKS